MTGKASGDQSRAQGRSQGDESILSTTGKGKERSATMATQQRQQQQSSLDALTSLVTEQGKTLDHINTKWEAFLTALPDAYVPRREVEGNFRELRERQAGHETRLTAMEEWRLAETQRAAQAQIALQTQIQAEAVNAVRAIAEAREKGQTTASEHRFALDARTLTFLQGVLLMIGGALLYFLLNHIPLH